MSLSRTLFIAVNKRSGAKPTARSLTTSFLAPCDLIRASHLSCDDREFTLRNVVFCAHPTTISGLDELQ